MAIIRPRRECRTRRSLLVSLLLPLLLLLVDSFPATAQPLPTSWIIKVRPGATLKSVRESIAGTSLLKGATLQPVVSSARGGASILSATGLDRYYVVDLKNGGENAVTALRLSPFVEEVAPNFIHKIAVAPTDSAFGEQWGLRNVDAEGAWETTRGDSSIIVGVIDTGIDFLHPDLVGAMAVNRAEDINGNGRFDPWNSTDVIEGVRGDIDGIDQDGNGLADDVIGFNFIDQSSTNVGDWQTRDSNPRDEQGHGTNVAGVIAATSGNGIGISGLAPNVRLLALRAFDATGNGEDDDVAAAIVYAADRGVKVLNLSFGDLFYSSLMRDAIRYAILRGVVVVASSGNDGGSGRHYPSNYPGVISVGAINVDNELPFFSTYGSQLSLVAPGVDIVTTAVDGRYVRVSGTSFAAPHVSATAALVRSVHPDWTPQEVRTAIELSAVDDRNRGWDIFFGAGRLNARRAVELPGPSLLEIESPEIDAGFDGETSVVVRGSAAAPFLESWELMLGTGEIPDVWTSLGGSEQKGRVSDTLGRFSVDGLPDTTITLRLAMRLTNGREIERRVRLYVDRTPPVIVAATIDTVWRLQERAIAITVRSSDLSRLSAWVRPAGSTGEPFRSIALEAERTGLVRDHFLLLTSSDLDPGVPYELYLVLTNTTGATTVLGSPDAVMTVVRDGQVFPRTGFIDRRYTLPYGYMLDVVDTIAGKKLVAINRFRRADYDKLVTYRFEDSAFHAVDSSSYPWLPRDFGDSDGDGLRELLVQSSGNSLLFEQRTAEGSVLESVILADTTTGNLFGSRLADLDGDGRDELIVREANPTNGSRRDAEYRVLRVTGSGADTLARLPNHTAPEFDERRSLFGPPLSAVGDFDGDGRQEILFGDNDADFLVYERQDDGLYTLVWTDLNDGEGGSEMLASADIDDDGRPEIVTGFRSLLRRNRVNEFDAPLWTVRVHRLNQDGSATLLWSDRFAYVRPTNPFRSGISTGDLDGAPGDEIALTIFPGLYILRWDALAGRIEPLWHLGGFTSPGDRTARGSTDWFGSAVGNASLIADFDQDGLQEIGVGNGDSIYFFQNENDPARTAPPAGLRGWSTGARSAHLEWNGVVGAERYIVYRGTRQPGSGTFQLDSIAGTTDTLFVDTSDALVEGREVAYSVAAVDESKPVPSSLLPGIVIMIPHAPATIGAAEATGDRNIRLRLTAPVRDELYRPAVVDIRRNGDPVEIASVVWANELTLMVTLQQGHPGERLEVRLTSYFRDYLGSPGDTVLTSTVIMDEAEEPGERFIATRALLSGPQTIAIDFNENVDPADAVDAGHYRIDPSEGVIDSVRIDPADPGRVYLHISRALPVGPTGRYYTVTITGLRSADGRRINNGAGSVVGLALNAESVNASFVYPHPFSISRDEFVMIAGLPLGGIVEIFSQRGVAISRLEATEGNGGVRWDGRDATGAPVPTGIYLYRVTLPTESGESIESELRKIAVVR